MTPAAPNTFLHLASCPEAADVIAEAVRGLGREEEAVLAVRWDLLGEGPLQDVDDGAAARVAWWGQLCGGPLDARRARELDDSEAWAGIRRAATPVILWHGPDPGERIFALRACWQLRDQPQRVHEVALVASGRQWPCGPRPAFYDAVPIAGPAAAMKAWAQRAKVNDVAARAQRWEELRSKAGDWIRTLDGEEIDHRPVMAYDADLLDACDDGHWTRSLLVLAKVIADNPTGTALMGWRIRELLSHGVLEGRGGENSLGLPEEVRRR